MLHMHDFPADLNGTNATCVSEWVAGDDGTFTAHFILRGKGLTQVLLLCCHPSSPPPPSPYPCQSNNP